MESVSTHLPYFRRNTAKPVFSKTSKIGGGGNFQIFFVCSNRRVLTPTTNMHRENLVYFGFGYEKVQKTDFRYQKRYMCLEKLRFWVAQSYFFANWSPEFDSAKDFTVKNSFITPPLIIFVLFPTPDNIFDEMKQPGEHNFFSVFDLFRPCNGKILTNGFQIRIPWTIFDQKHAVTLIFSIVLSLVEAVQKEAFS